MAIFRQDGAEASGGCDQDRGAKSSEFITIEVKSKRTYLGYKILN
jgi:hypothetical protein